MVRKQQLGQFYTVNAVDMISEYVDFIPKMEVVIDPFAGDWDLLNIFAGRNKLKAYDIDPQNKKTEKRDTLLNPPQYNRTWVVTNPPYLAKNKSKDKTIFEKYGVDDLYKASMLSLMECAGGILIVPTNFLFGKEHKDIRKEFFANFNITNATVYEQQMFNDTSVTVCVFPFEKRKSEELNKVVNISVKFIPDEVVVNYRFEEQFNYTLSEAIICKEFSEPTITKRAIQDDNNERHYTKIIVNCLDKTSKAETIQAEHGEIYLGTKKDRTKFSPIFEGVILSDSEEKEIVKLFNFKINKLREEYHSAFLSCYREGKRKRLDFETAYKILESCMYEALEKRGENDGQAKYDFRTVC